MTCNFQPLPLRLAGFLLLSQTTEVINLIKIITASCERCRDVSVAFNNFSDG